MSCAYDLRAIMYNINVLAFFLNSNPLHKSRCEIFYLQHHVGACKCLYFGAVSTNSFGLGTNKSERRWTG